MVSRGFVAGRVPLGLAALMLIVWGGLSCSSDRVPTSEVHDTGHELIGPPEAAVATVDGERVTLAEANLLASFWLDATAPEARRTQSRRQLQRRAIDNLVQQMVLVDEAERRGYAVADSLIDGRIAQWEAQSGSSEQVQERLERSHVTLGTVREHLRRDAVIQQMISELVSDTLEVRDDEVAAYYQEHPEHFDNLSVHARHILLMTTPGAPPESLAATRQRAEALRQRILAGEDLGELSRRHSDCPSASQGGDLGFARRGQWVPPFEQAALALAPGEISEVVETNYGFHIIEVLEINDQDWTPLEDVAPAIRQFLLNQKTQEAVDGFAAQLMAEAQIEHLVPPPDADVETDPSGGR